ncbi:MAG: DNA protecting protein DprA [Clostridiales bacterium GWB2_37_7]|nr:MAG: DNA protecting protein DprA [Clostridiales bacterium GWB2_37_7]
MRDLKYWVWLSSLPGIGSRKFYNLIDHFETAENVFNSTTEELKRCGVINNETVNVVVNNRSIEKIDKYLIKVKDNDVNVYLSSQEEYPSNLKNIYDPPPILYSLGDLKPEDNEAIAIVGSRKATEYGLKTAEKLASELVQNGLTVVSGMALGIDAAAHKGAIKGGGRTIAVFGCGVTNPQPRSNTNLYREILKSGAVVSEYPLGIKPIPGNFPARNRIISGLSLGTLVVEASIKSGSLITADFALEQGRDVYAVPGNISSPNSIGTNNLIKNGAKLVNCIEDILYELPGNYSVKAANAMQFELNKVEALITALLENGKSIDDLVIETGMEINEILSNVAIMELKGIIKSINGIYYCELTT